MIMIILFYLFIFILGAAIGSFLGVIVDRTASQESFWKGRSHCDHCRHKLHMLDLIPVLSFFLLKRKCRYCHKELSWFYPLIEFTTGLSYVAAAYVVLQPAPLMITQLQSQLLLLYYFLLIGALIAIFFIDLKYGIIPFKIVLFALLVTIVWYVASPIGLPFLISILGAAFGASGFFFLLFLATKGRGMGFGDVVYVFLMGFTLGFPKILLGLYIAFVVGAIVSLLLIALKKKRFRGGTIPFGPFLVLGTITSLLWGDFLITWILRSLTY